MGETIFKELPRLGYIYHWIQHNIHLFHNEVVGPIVAEIILKSEDAAVFLSPPLQQNSIEGIYISRKEFKTGRTHHRYIQNKMRMWLFVNLLNRMRLIILNIKDTCLLLCCASFNHNKISS
jgi:hypothetical protein